MGGFSRHGAQSPAVLKKATGAANVGFKHTLDANTVQRTIEEKLAEVVSIYDYGAACDGVTDDSAAVQNAINAVNSAGGGDVLFPSKVLKLDGQIVAKSNVRLVCLDPRKAEFDFDGVLGVSSGTARCITGTSIDGFVMFGIKATADVTSFTNNGFDTYVLRIDSSTNCHLISCEVRDGENGFAFRNGCSDCSMINIVAFNCHYHSVASWGTSGAPNRRMTLEKIRAYSDAVLDYLAPTSGVFVEETYDSDIDKITGHDCGVGFRLENSCDNTVSNIKCYDNWKNGTNVYNYSQRNTISNVVCFNNNRSNDDAVDTTTRGNDNTHYSGLNLEVGCNNNNFNNIAAFQTQATTVPFASGSDEPWLGSKLEDATSAAVGRVRRIEVTSGSWAGGDAAGIFHLVEVAGTFGSSNVIKNITTRIPYNSGGTEKPRMGDVLTDGTATGIVLWVSQQSGNGGDWSIGNSDGYIYLVDVVGSWGSSGDIDNVTTGATNIATINGAPDAEDSDIATTNGAMVAGNSKGFQKYGVGINVRNQGGTITGDSYNNFLNVQCFNNDLNQFEDRGFYNNVANISENAPIITRNAA